MEQSPVCNGRRCRQPEGAHPIKSFACGLIKEDFYHVSSSFQGLQQSVLDQQMKDVGLEVVTAAINALLGKVWMECAFLPKMPAKGVNEFYRCNVVMKLKKSAINQ